MVDLKGVPIKTIPLEKITVSVIITDFVTKFTDFTGDDPGHVRSKFHYNVWFYLKMASI